MKSTDERIARMTFASVYPLYIAKVIRKGSTIVELDDVICWFLDINQDNLNRYKEEALTFEQLFAEVKPVTESTLITGKICGIDIASIETPLTQKVRQLDKIVDELTKGWKLEKIKRS